MKGKDVKGLFKTWSVKTGAILLAAALTIGGNVWIEQRNSTPIPELVTFVDADGTITITEEEVPLAAPKVTVTTKTKKKTKKIRMKKAAKKTYSKRKNSKKTKTNKTSTANTTTTTKTVTNTNVVNQYKKGSRINTQTTTIKTTVTKTVVTKQNASSVSVPTSAVVDDTKKISGEISVEKAAPKLDTRVKEAFETLGFKIEINPKVSYAGVFDARMQSITLRAADNTVYHEMGHFLGFLAGNADRSAAFQKVYAAEKAKYTAPNRAYVLSSPSEYFAESFKDYTLNPSELKQNRPKTYAAITEALNKITTEHVAKVKSVYEIIWS